MRSALLGGAALCVDEVGEDEGLIRSRARMGERGMGARRRSWGEGASARPLQLGGLGRLLGGMGRAWAEGGAGL